MEVSHKLLQEKKKYRVFRKGCEEAKWKGRRGKGWGAQKGEGGRRRIVQTDHIALQDVIRYP